MNRRKWSLVSGLATLLAGGALALTSVGAMATQPNPDTGHKVDICHATGSVDNNPYNLLNVDIASAGYPDYESGHADNNHQKGRDIIPPYDYGTFHYPGKNWTPEGQAIWNNECNAVTPSPSPSPSPSESASPSPSPSPSASASPSPTPTETSGPNPTPTPSASATATPTPTATGSVSPTATPTGEVLALAETGGGPPFAPFGLGLGLLLMAFGGFLLLGAFRRASDVS